MQNKPNFLNNQMNITFCLTKLYGNFYLFGRRKNKPNSNPIKPNLKNAKMNLSPVMTKHYEQKTLLPPSAKQSQFQTQSNPISIVFLQPSAVLGKLACG